MKLNSRIEHTCLNPKATAAEIATMHEEVLKHQFRGVCVAPYFLKQAAKLASNADYKVITVVDFPYGYSHPMSKVESVKKASDLGADGVDVVINYVAAINEDWVALKNEVEAVVHAGHMRNLEVKLILESSAYSSKILQKVVEICESANPNFLKTNTGTNNNVTSISQVKLIQRFQNTDIPIKASGGIRSMQQAEELIQEGVQLLGASSATKW